MKKFVLIFAAAFMLCSTATMAQKVDQEGITAKLAKCDADAANAKKSGKAATWVSRGDAYLNSIIEPTEALFVGADVSMLEIACGKPKSTGTETIHDREFQTLSYPYFTAYVQDGKVVSWAVEKEIRSGAIDVVVESYSKAVELDPSVATKIKSSLESATNYYKMLGNVSADLGNMSGSAAAFITASDLTELSYNVGKPDASLLFFAGYMLAIDGVDNPESFIKGEAVLTKALESGYSEIEDANEAIEATNRGNIYYYLYSCAYPQREGNSSKLIEARDYLVAGVEKYPTNERIFEGLMQLYTNEEGMGNPEDLLGAVEKQIAANANNYTAWFSRGRIYYAMEDYDECITSFDKVVAINPNLFEGHFYLGLFHMLKADNMLEEINSATYTDQSKYNADLEALNNAYAVSIPSFESAYELKPTDRGTLEYLKQLCFRLRDMPGVMDKYTKYNDLLKAM